MRTSILNAVIVVGFPTHLFFMRASLFINFCQKNGPFKKCWSSKSKSRSSMLLIFFEECGSLCLRNTPPAPLCALHLPSSPVFRFFTLFATSSPVQPYLPVLISPVLLRQSTNLSFLPFTLWIVCLALISTHSLSWNLYSFLLLLTTDFRGGSGGGGVVMLHLHIKIAFGLLNANLKLIFKTLIIL